MAVSIISRRRFLAACLTVPAVALLPARRAEASLPGAAPSPGDHPTPRPGIDASRVPLASELQDSRRSIAAFDEVREIPQIVDGIRCQCGCAKLSGHYSLLSCFETKDAMAKSCESCRKQARFAYRMHEAGKSLDEIRRAVDQQFR